MSFTIIGQTLYLFHFISVLIGYVVGSYDLNNISYQLVYLLAYVYTS